MAKRILILSVLVSILRPGHPSIRHGSIVNNEICIDSLALLIRFLQVVVLPKRIALIAGSLEVRFPEHFNQFLGRQAGLDNQSVDLFIGIVFDFFLGASRCHFLFSTAPSGKKCEHKDK